METSRAKEISSEILRQLGGSKFIVMTGAKNLSFDSDGSLNMKIGRNSKGVTHVEISLNGLDLYDMKAFRFWGGKITDKGSHENFYNDQLQDLFEDLTGLYVTFNARR